MPGLASEMRMTIARRIMLPAILDRSGRQPLALQKPALSPINTHLSRIRAVFQGVGMRENERRTFNAERRTSNVRQTHSAFGVRRSMFGVRFFPHQIAPPAGH